MSDPGRMPPMPNDPYDQGYPQGGPGYAPSPPPSRRAPHRDPYRDGSGTRRTALVIQLLGDIAAVFLGLWILLYLLDANQDNPFVGFVHTMADGLGWWAEDMFTMDTEGLRVLLNYGLPALIYLLVGHGIGTWIRRAADA